MSLLLLIYKHIFLGHLVPSGDWVSGGKRIYVDTLGDILRRITKVDPLASRSTCWHLPAGWCGRGRVDDDGTEMIKECE